jgi:thiamine-monophosphate kinase
MAGEFDLIARYFRPLAGAAGLDLSDDAAVLTPPVGRELVLTADALVGGVHFRAGDPPGLIARKALRVNLSDLAAMAATPLGYLLTIAAPRDATDAFFADFTKGLAEDQAEFGIVLLGGDTTATDGPLCLSVTMIGHVAPGAALRRNGARPGDGLWVSGSIGDGALGLAALSGRLADPTGELAGRYLLPRPRVGLALGGIASAALDVSDGLVQDVGHICAASGVGAVIEAGLVPLSAAARAAGPAWRDTILTGVDDYELAFAVPVGSEAKLLAMAAAAGVPVTRIGGFVGGPAVVSVRDEAGAQIAFSRPGWQHF